MNDSENNLLRTEYVGQSAELQETGFLVKKFLQKGFDSLSPEEMASTLINPSFGPDFKKSTGIFFFFVKRGLSFENLLCDCPRMRWDHFFDTEFLQWIKMIGIDWASKYQATVVDK
jgi:hypothetical protein